MQQLPSVIPALLAMSRHQQHPLPHSNPRPRLNLSPSSSPSSNPRHQKDTRPVAQGLTELARTLMNSVLPSNRVTTQSDNGDRIVVSTTGTPIRRTNGGPRVVVDPNQVIANRGNEAYQAARSRRDRDRRTVYGTRQHETQMR